MKPRTVHRSIGGLGGSVRTRRNLPAGGVSPSRTSRLGCCERSTSATQHRLTCDDLTVGPVGLNWLCVGVDASARPLETVTVAGDDGFEVVIRTCIGFSWCPRTCWTSSMNEPPKMGSRPTPSSARRSRTISIAPGLSWPRAEEQFRDVPVKGGGSRVSGARIRRDGARRAARRLREPAR